MKSYDAVRTSPTTTGDMKLGGIVANGQLGEFGFDFSKEGSKEEDEI